MLVNFLPTKNPNYMDTFQLFLCGDTNRIKSKMEDGSIKELYELNKEQLISSIYKIAGVSPNCQEQRGANSTQI